MDKKKKKSLLKRLGHAIKVKRVDNQLTQYDLAEIIQSTPGHLGQIERGYVDPSFTMLIRIASALLISPKDLMP